MKKIDKVRELMKSVHQLDILNSMHENHFNNAVQEKKIEKRDEHDTLRNDFERIKQEVIQKIEKHIEKELDTGTVLCIVEFFTSPAYKKLEKVHGEIFQIYQEIMQKFFDSIGVKLGGT